MRKCFGSNKKEVEGSTFVGIFNVFILMWIYCLSTAYGEVKELNIQILTQQSLANNFDINIQKSKLLEKEALLLKAKGQFDYNLNFDLNYIDSNTPSSSTLDGGGVAATVESLSFEKSMTLSKSLGLTGTELSLPMSVNRQETTSATSIFPVYDQTSFGLSVTQPLIRLFTKDYFLKSVIEADYDQQIENEKMRKEHADTLFKIIETYFDVLKDQDNLKHLEATLANDEQNLKFIRAKKKVGKSSRVEVSEATVKRNKTKERFFNTKNSLLRKLNDLKAKVFHRSDISIEFKGNDSEMSAFEGIMNLKTDEIYKTAIERRAEFKELTLEKEKATRNIKFSSVDKMPSLEVGYTLTSQGLSDSLGEAKDEGLAGDFLSHNYTLSIEQPIFRHVKKASHKINLIRLKQAELKLKNFEINLKLEIDTKLNEARSQRQIITAMETSLSAQQEKYKFFDKRFRIGAISVFEFNKVAIEKEKALIELNEARYKFNKILVELIKIRGDLIPSLLSKN